MVAQTSLYLLSGIKPKDFRERHGGRARERQRKGLAAGAGVGGVWKGGGGADGWMKVGWSCQSHLSPVSPHPSSLC